MAVGSTTSAGLSLPASKHLSSGWMRWLLPSASDLVFLTLLGVLVFTNLSVRLLGDAGIGWHIRAGQLILANHAVPRSDPFSATMSGKPWFAWEWSYDVIVGRLDRKAGLNGVVLFTALIIATTFAWTFGLLVRRGTNVAAAVVLILLSASASMIHFLARPHVLSWLFTLIWFVYLESAAGAFPFPRSYSESRRLDLLNILPFSMLSWVNLHGGFLVGFVLLAIYWLDAVWEWFRLKEDRFDEALQKLQAGRLVRALTIMGSLSVAATFVNPYGYHLHVHIYRYLTNRFLMDHIDEFQSPNFHGVAQKCFAVLLLLALVGLAAESRSATRRRIRPSQLLLVLFAVYSGLYASRNIPVASLLLTLVTGPWLSDAILHLTRRLSLANFLQRMQAVELSLTGHLWPLAGVALCCATTAHGGSLAKSRLMNAHFSAQRFPVAAVDYLRAHPGQSAILAPDYWGGYLIYRLYPQVKVVIDDRHDFYGEQYLKSYLKMTHVQPGWSDFLTQQDVRCILVPKDSALANIVLETPAWQPIYRDEVAITFVRDPAP
ncbi:MAG: hypothetical protein ABSF59_19025 [Candidatus Sulfotelmatobacter sp.]|jgi:hypothetical protein